MPDFGEPICVAPPSTLPPEKDFAAELVSVTFKSGVKASHGQAEITGANWEAGKEGEVTDDWKATAQKLGLPEEPYSKRAAVFLIKGAAGAKYDVEVKVKVTKSENVSGDGKLIGNFNGLVIEGTCPTSAGEHTVAATITEPPDAIQGYRGKVSWGIEVADIPLSLSLGTSLAEVYFLIAKPKATPYRKGVWAEVLRFLCGKVGVVGEKTGEAAAAKVTEYCHLRHKLRYDTFEGAPKYGAWMLGGTFKLGAYMERTNPVCNCYDQAAAVQALSLALGAAVGWRYLEPFGFIKETHLVGVDGLCNNPFFEGDESKKLVPASSKDRWPFSNHAFSALPNDNILDACAKPHTGNEAPGTYVSDSIDDTPSLYPHRICDHAGKASEILPGPGVSAVV
jgi:hypothetical protein